MGSIDLMVQLCHEYGLRLVRRPPWPWESDRWVIMELENIEADFLLTSLISLPMSLAQAHQIRSHLCQHEQTPRHMRPCYSLEGPLKASLTLLSPHQSQTSGRRRRPPRKSPVSRVRHRSHLQFLCIQDPPQTFSHLREKRVWRGRK